MLFQHTEHEHVTRNLNEVHSETLTLGDRVADKVAATMGSWSFIIVQSIALVLWIAINTIAFFVHWDAYPYILLNLALSFQAAFATPIILMSQNRQSAKDRLAAEHDYQINLKNETRLVETHAHLNEQDTELLRQTKMLLDQQNELLRQTGLLLKIVEEAANEKQS